MGQGRASRTMFAGVGHTDPAEPRLGNDLQAGFSPPAHPAPVPHPGTSRPGCRDRRSAVIETAHRIEIRLETVCAMGSTIIQDAPRWSDMHGGAGGIAHVMQTIEESDEVVASTRILRRRLLEGHAIGDPGLLGGSPGTLDRPAW